MRKLISREQLESHVKAKDEGRRNFDCVQFTERGALSTDGHLAWCVPYPCDGDPDSVPEAMDREGDDTPSVLVTDGLLTKAARDLPKGAAVNPILRSALLTTNDGGVRITSTDLSIVNEASVRAAPVDFPDVERVLDRHPAETEIHEVALAVLEKLVKAAKKAGADRVAFHHSPEGSDGIPVIARDDMHNTVASGVVMPMVKPTVAPGDARASNG